MRGERSQKKRSVYAKVAANAKVVATRTGHVTWFFCENDRACFGCFSIDMLRRMGRVSWAVFLARVSCENAMDCNNNYNNA